MSYGVKMKKTKTLADWIRDPKFKDAVETVFPFGLTSPMIIANRTGLDKKRVAYLITKLQQLRVLHRLGSSRLVATRAGRPEFPYGFSPRSAQELRDLGYKNAAWLDLDGPLDMAHRFCMALVASQTEQAVRMEQVIPYAKGRNVRADLVVPDGAGQERIIEIEQALGSNHRSRAVTKLKSLGELFATNPLKLAREVMIVFNLTDKDLPKTLRVWQSALREVGEIPLAVHYSLLVDFYAAGNYVDWQDFPLLTPSEGKRGKVTPSEEPLEEVMEEYPRNEVPMADLVGLLPADRPIETDDEDPTRLFHLGALAYAIHQLDFGEGGCTSVYAEHPANSLGALREFLHHPSNRRLLFLLRGETRAFRKQSGVTMLRHASTRLAWSFLRYFGFGRGGPLILFVRVPEMGENTSEIQFELLFTPRVNDKRLVPPDPEDKSILALGWLLSALITYPKELGLAEEK
jgi:hypothetical protein